MIHRIDKHILTQLVTHETCTFSSLRPPGVESNTLTYRLKRFTNLGYISRDEDNHYYLTPQGRFYTDRMNLGKFESRQLPKPATLMVVREGNKWLMHKRLIHPLRDVVAFAHANVHPGQSVVGDAERRLKKIIGLDTTFKYRGCAYLTFYKDGQLEAYNQMNIVVNCSPVTGEIIENAEERFGRYFWVEDPDFTRPEYLPSIQLIQQAIEQSEGVFFIEHTFDLSAAK